MRYSLEHSYVLEIPRIFCLPPNYDLQVFKPVLKTPNVPCPWYFTICPTANNSGSCVPASFPTNCHQRSKVSTYIKFYCFFSKVLSELLCSLMTSQQKKRSVCNVKWKTQHLERKCLALQDSSAFELERKSQFMHTQKKICHGQSNHSQVWRFISLDDMAPLQDFSSLLE